MKTNYHGWVRLGSLILAGGSALALTGCEMGFVGQVPPAPATAAAATTPSGSASGTGERAGPDLASWGKKTWDGKKDHGKDWGDDWHDSQPWQQKDSGSPHDDPHPGYEDDYGDSQDGPGDHGDHPDHGESGDDHSYPIPDPRRGDGLESTGSPDSVAAAGRRGRPVGESCNSSGALCVGIKYVVYQSKVGDPVLNELDVIRSIQKTNEIWRSCGIQFQVDEMLPVLPRDYGLRYRTANHWELNQIREVFEDPEKLLVVTTGPWDRAGTLGNTHANAWTNMPGERWYGAILEESVGQYPEILAHEIGHYLSLDHESDARSLMSPVIFRNSTELDREQCRSARWAIRTYWRKMLR